NLFACTGELRTTGGQEGQQNRPADSRGVDSNGEALPITAAGTNLRRLSRVELNQSVHAILAELPDDFDAGTDIPEDNHVELAFSVPGTVSEIEVKRFMDMAEEALVLLADDATDSGATCEADESDCARDFISEF